MKTGPYSVRLEMGSGDEGETKKCNWCGKNFIEERVQKKPYCLSCEKKCARECVRCHKPYPDLHLFNRSPRRCDSCQSTHEKAKSKKNTKVEEMVVGDDDDDDGDGGSSVPSSPDSQTDEEDGGPSLDRKTKERADMKSADVSVKPDVREKKTAAGDIEQKQLGDLMQALTEHHLKSQKPDGKPKRKYAKREKATTKNQEKVAEVEAEFLRSFLELRKLDRGGGSKNSLQNFLHLHM